MAITATDIKLLESERMADTSDGGGRRTSRVIPDGVAGNIFPKVSRLDSVYGRVNLRKVYGAIQTADVDTYAGAHVVVTDAPDNANIHTTLFSTSSDFDNRTAARDRIESYVTSGPESRMTLFGRQLSGQQSIVVYQREEEALPEIGDVYCLSTEPSVGVVTAQQYFRVQTVESEVRTFTESVGSSLVDFKRRVITIGIGIPLRYEFNGPENATQLTTVLRPSRLRTTTVVDAARYFGIKKLSEAAAQNAMTIKVDSVYTPIVPTTNRETPVSNAQVGQAAALVPARASAVTESASVTFNTGSTVFTTRPITPGTLSLSGLGLSATTDDALGNITATGFAATIDYQTGAITKTVGGGASGPLSLTYTPAGAVMQTAQTDIVNVTVGNRGTVYVATINPIPAPGTLFIDYRALGKWYRLRDDGTGALAGSDAAYGVGSIDYVSGAMVLTLGAMPDVGSAIIFGWGTPISYAIHAGATSNAGTAIRQRIQLTDLPIVANSVALTYTSGGQPKTAADNASGVITGTGVSGYVDYTTGEMNLAYTTTLPDADTSVIVTYSKDEPTTQGNVVVRSFTDNAFTGTTAIMGTSVTPGYFNARIPFQGTLALGPVVITDNGLGILVAKAGQTVPGIGANKNLQILTDQIVGSIDYADGSIELTGNINLSGSIYTPIPPTPLPGPDGGLTRMSGTTPAWTQAETQAHPVAGVAIFGWRDDSVPTSILASTKTATFSESPLRIPLITTLSDRIVPGSLTVSAGGKKYIDRNGSLYTDVSNATGSGTLAGTVDYVTGEMSLSTWTNGAALGLSVDTCLTTHGECTAWDIYFRTTGAPIRPGSFYVQVATEDGTLLTGSSNDSGIITGAKVNGVVDQDTGVVTLRFGQVVTAAGNESKWWYRPEAVVGGNIFAPELIIPATLRYNAVVIANLPLNADILGLDPVRLPADGKVPIYRPADVVVIHNTDSFTLPNPAVASAVYSVGRTNLSEVWVADQNGVKINPDQYVASLTAGTITMSAALNLTGLVQPLIVKHRVEDLALVSDVQINGQLTLSAPLTRSYPANTSFVSSAILFGDMNARVENVFDLLSFASWSNTPGTGATAQFNDIDFPIEILNNGGLTERWRINFTSTTAFQVVGENLGVIATGNTTQDCSPTNALTGLPYFVIRANGWGSGWSAGNQLRFNTVGAAAPIWIARTVLPGATLEGDSFSLQMRGDVDA